MISTTTDLVKTLNEWVPEKYSIVIKGSDPVLTIRVTKELSDEQITTVEARVLKYSSTTPVYLIISDCKAGDFKKVITNLVNAYFPAISRIFITNN